MTQPKAAHDPDFEILHITRFPQSAQSLTSLAVIRNKALSQAPPPWCHNFIPWWRHIQNITNFWNLELDTLCDVKTKGKYWLKMVFLTWDKNKIASLRDMIHTTSPGVTAQSYYYLQKWPIQLHHIYIKGWFTSRHITYLIMSTKVLNKCVACWYFENNCFLLIF